MKFALERALGHSPQLVEVREQLNAAKSEVSTRRAAFFPSLRAELKAGTYHDRIPNPGELSIPATARDRNQYIGQLVLDQPILQGLGLFDGVAWAVARRKKASQHLIEMANKTARDVIQVYFGLQLTEAQLKAEREMLGFLTKKLSQVRQQRAQGRGTELQELQAEYAAQSKIPVIQDLETEWDIKKLKLSALTGETFGGEWKLTDQLVSANKVLEESQMPKLNEAVQKMLTANSELMQLEAAIEETRSEGSLNSAKHWPSLSLTLSAGTNAFQRSDLATSDSLTYSGELKLNVPIFSGLSSFHESDQTQAKVSALRMQFEHKRSQLIAEATQAFRDWETSALRVEAEKKNAALTRRAIDQAESLFRVGRATLTEVLDSYSNALSATRALDDAIYRRVDAIARIRSLLGSLVPPTQSDEG